jgi:hypothetical protein
VSRITQGSANAASGLGQLLAGWRHLVGPNQVESPAEQILDLVPDLGLPRRLVAHDPADTARQHGQHHHQRRRGHGRRCQPATVAPGKLGAAAGCQKASCLFLDCGSASPIPTKF